MSDLVAESLRASSVISARQLSKEYGPFVAVQKISFSIAAGQVVALVGPNGAGKTTVMRMLTGYLAPTSGTATIGGFDIQRERLGAAACIGYLPENGPLYPDMTPLELLRFFGDARKLPGAVLSRRIEQVADQCDIRSVFDRPIGKLSKGLRQRVGLAQALLHDPAVLILDEPTSGLDPNQIRDFRVQVCDLRKHKTLLISTHILQEVDAIADRVLLIHNGELLLDGPAADPGDAGSLEERFYRLTRDTKELAETTSSTTKIPAARSRS